MSTLLVTVGFLLLAASPSPPAVSKMVTPRSGKTQLKISIEPEGAVLFLDGKRRGTGAKARVFQLPPGAHRVRVVFGRDEHEETLFIKRGESRTYAWRFEDDQRGRQRGQAVAKNDVPAEPTNQSAPEESTATDADPSTYSDADLNEEMLKSGL